MNRPLPLSPFLLGFFLLIAACGKVGDPLPPFIQVPASAGDLAVEQFGYELRFSWTNPAVNVDGSRARDLARAVLLGGGEITTSVEATSAGEPQSIRIDARDLVGTRRSFTVRFETSSGRTSAESNRVVATPVGVPGPVLALRAAFDAERVRLEWDAPRAGTELVGGYRLYRSGTILNPTPVVGESYDDLAVQEGTTYEYVVVALLEGDGVWVEGVAPEPLRFDAVDRTSPAPPTGLALIPGSGGSGAFLHWEAGVETDLARYRVFRRATPSGTFEPIDDGLQTTTAIFDPDYRSGYVYAVSAVDRAGNESRMSEPEPR